MTMPKRRVRLRSILNAGDHSQASQLKPAIFVLILFLALVQQHGHLLEKDELLKLVWPDTFVEEANLSYNISLIRKALGDGENGQRYIGTVPMPDYRFVAYVKDVSSSTSIARRAGDSPRPELERQVESRYHLRRRQ